ncbi:MAG TPA: pyridoxal-phosphate dependent enzyme [Steroidobacteraceae bacterium]|jgi:threonine dehydratase|nr:pyridoxal-phosphate dependent enzyme [Steroidobacteraceae bacterium]
MIDLNCIEGAAARIARHVRRTPLWRVPNETLSGAFSYDLYLKLELLQVTGSFKPRGAFNRVLLETELPRGLVTSSGGNHGIAVAYIGKTLGIPVSIPLPATVAPEKLAAMRSLGADAEIVGANFFVSNARAKEIAAERGFLYLHPFAEREIVMGQGTIGLELLEDLPDLDVVVIAVGGGGLLGGVAAAIKQKRPEVTIIGVEPVGADALTRSLAAGHLVTLDKISTKAATLAPPMTGQINLDLARKFVNSLVHVTDEEMESAAQWLWRHCFISAELGGAASTAALLSGRIPIEPGQKVVSIVCGAGTAGMNKT